MDGIIITFREIIELNHLLNEKGLDAKVHLHDTCGRQSLSVDMAMLEVTKDSVKVKKIIEEYFKNKGIQATFINEKLDFILN